MIRVESRERINAPHLYETLLARNRIIALELENLIIAITLAKIDMVNPVIFGSTDLQSIFQEVFTGLSLAQISSVASVRVLGSDRLIHFILSFPKPKLVCKKITIFPVAHDGIVLHLEENVVAKCNGHIIAVTSYVGPATAKFCKEAAETSCAQGLQSGSVAHCATRPSHLAAVTSIDEGMLVVNDHWATVSIDGSPLENITGTHLITFATVAYVNGSKYVNYNATPDRPGIKI